MWVGGGSPTARGSANERRRHVNSGAAGAVRRPMPATSWRTPDRNQQRWRADITGGKAARTALDACRRLGVRPSSRPPKGDGEEEEGQALRAHCKSWG